MLFKELPLIEPVLKALESEGYTQPTPIQEQAIPIILERRDLLGCAQTGTGKTAAFAVPILQLLFEERTASGKDQPNKRPIRSLILTPTRELAIQIGESFTAYGRHTGVRNLVVFGGVSQHAQTEALRRGTDVLVATPGRLLDLMNQGFISLRDIGIFVLDEADRMLDMGFMPDLTRIIDQINPKRQSLLFSATMPSGVMRLARTLLRNPATVSIALSKPAEGVTQSAFMVNDRQKIPLITEILKDKTGERILIFGSTKQAVGMLFQKLKAKGFSVGQISSDLQQEDREKGMLAFRNRQVDILVATDVLSRGIDVEGIDLVINFDVPRDAEDYVHRIGRTARAARKGAAITLVSHTDLVRFKRIEQLIGNEVPKQVLPTHIASLEEEGRREPRGGRRAGDKKQPFRGRGDRSRGRGKGGKKPEAKG